MQGEPGMKLPVSWAETRYYLPERGLSHAAVSIHYKHMVGNSRSYRPNKSTREGSTMFSANQLPKSLETLLGFGAFLVEV